MNIAYIQVHDLSEIDFDNLYERCRAAIDADWPEKSPLTSEERKENMRAIIESGMNNEWPGLNVHRPHDTYIVLKMLDLDTEKVMGFVSGYLIEGGIFDGRHSLISPDDNGSRNWLYTEQTQAAVKNRLDDFDVTKWLYRNIPANSIQHRILRNRAASGAYELIEDVDSPTLGPKFRNILVQYN
jgi:hypothetical protein